MKSDQNRYDINSFTPSLRNTERSSNLIDLIPSLVAYIDKNLCYQYVNAAYEKWLGVNADSVIGKTVQSVVGKEMFLELKPHFDSVLMGKPSRFEIKTHNKQGMRSLDISLTPDFKNKTVEGVAIHIADITDRKKTEASFQDFVETATIGLHWVSEDGIIIWANQAELDLLGYTREEYIGHHIAEFHADQQVISDILKRLSEKERLNQYEVVMKCKDGSTRHVSINSSVLWEDDKFIHTRCFTIDITAQKLAVQSNSESEDRFKMMANLIPLVIWTTDENGDCNYLNIRWQELTGKNVEIGFGNRWLNWIHPGDRQQIQRSWQESLSVKKPFDAKFRYINSLGGYAIHYANASPRYSAEGNFIGYIGILQDISSQEQIKSSLERIVMNRTEDLRRKNVDLKAAENSLKEKNQELEKKNQELSSFAYVCSHDLQEPLRKIQVFSERILELEQGKFSEKGKDYFSRIKSAIIRMRTLITDLLAYSTANSSEAKFEITDLNQLLQDVRNELREVIEQKNATIESPWLPKANIIPFQFHQLLINLLSNALKFSKADTKPQIILKSGTVKGEQVPKSLDKAKTYHHIAVSDNGIGFDPLFSTRIFEIFQRLHGKSEYEGTGIGLAICKKIIENHKGTITAEGRINGGATFHIYFPAGTARKIS